MAEKDIVLKLVLESDVAKKSIGELKQDFKDLTDQLDKTKVGTKAYIDTLQSLGIVKGKLTELKQHIIALNPERQLAAIAKIGSTVASGFAAAQAASALFGNESEDLMKVLVKVQAATALASGLQGLIGFSKALQTAGIAMRTFAMSNPFGLILIAIVAVTAAIIALTKNINEESEAFKVAKKSAEDYAKAHEDARDSIDKMRLDLKVLTGDIKQSQADVQKTILNFQAKRVELQKKHDEEIKELKDKRLKGDFISETEFGEAMGLLQEAQSQELFDLEDEKSVKLKIIRKKRRNEIKEEEEDGYDARQALLEKLKPKYEEPNPEEDPFFIIPQKQNEMNENMIEDQTNFDTNIIKGRKELNQELFKYLDEYFAYKEALTNAELNLENAKWQGLMTLANIGQQLSGKNKALANTLFAVEKGLAIAQIVVSTQKEIAGYYSNPTWKVLPDGGLALATAASAAAKIRAAISITTITASSIQKFMGGAGSGDLGGGGGNIPNPSGGSASLESPQDKQQAIPTKTQTNQQGEFTGFMGQQEPIRAYVVETDISEKQKTIR